MLKNLCRLYASPFLLAKNSFAPLECAYFGSKARPASGPDDPRITLVDADENVSIVNLSEARAASAERNLKLVLVTDLDVKTRRPLYKLLSHDAYKEELLERRQLKKASKTEFSVKGEKTIIFKVNIGEHDFETRCKNIHKWLAKPYSVKVTIEGVEENLAKSEKLYTRIVDRVKDTCKVQQRSSKSSNIKFHLQPLPPKPGEALLETQVPSESQETRPPTAGTSAGSDDVVLNKQQRREMHTSSGHDKKL